MGVRGMPAEAKLVVESVKENLKTTVMRTESANPAIQRLRSRVLSNAETSDIITSYDRMHHRHNRS
ncbi:YhhA family cyclophane-containing RiPP [Rhizobium sp. L51/94]|uniref:YhhA family cyclophane-containing RiPP n=1 Tax=unclassified Rhizobium TaxID=2613769 RepID=UPI0035A8A73E